MNDVVIWMMKLLYVYIKCFLQAPNSVISHKPIKSAKFWSNVVDNHLSLTPAQKNDSCTHCIEPPESQNFLLSGLAKH